MNVIEERIRAATRAAADTVAPDSVPPLELPAPRPRHLGRWLQAARSPGATWTPWAARLTPWAAALAVLVIVIVMVSVSHPARYGTSSGGSSASVAGPDVPLGPPVSTYVRSGQVPPYFIALTPSDAVVHLTDGAAAVATIRPSLPGGKVVAVTAAGDDRTFVLAEQAKFNRVAEFYQVRLSASGRPGTPARLPMSVADVKTMTGLALSPDGTRLAIAVAPGGGVQQVRLYQVHSGATRTWTARGGTIGVSGATTSLSWPASQRTLAFNWWVGQTRSVRLLDLGNTSGSLLAASRPVVILPGQAGKGQTQYQCGYLIMTPDGSAVVCPSSTITDIAKIGPVKRSTGFPEFSATTGRLIRILGNWTQDQTEPYVFTLLWSDTSGRVLIGAIHSAGQDRVGVISGNRFTQLNDQRSLGTYVFGTW